MPFVPRLLSHVLPTMSHDVEQVRQAANRVNTSLMEYIMSLSEKGSKSGSSPSAQLQLLSASANNSRELGNIDRRDSNFSTKTPKPSNRDPAMEIKAAESKMVSRTRTPTPAEDCPASPPQGADLDYQAAVNALTLQFLNEHEATRVAAIAWLIMLHRKAPGKVINHVFTRLLTMLIY